MWGHMSNWLHQLSGLVATAVGTIPVVRGEIRLCCGDATAGLSLASGDLTTGQDAGSELRADEKTMQELLRGDISLQAAYRAGRVVLTGDPEPFLFLAMILEQQRASPLVSA